MPAPPYTLQPFSRIIFTTSSYLQNHGPGLIVVRSMVFVFVKNHQRMQRISASAPRSSQEGEP
jgi:hypothetical protein